MTSFLTHAHGGRLNGCVFFWRFWCPVCWTSKTFYVDGLGSRGDDGVLWWVNDGPWFQKISWCMTWYCGWKKSCTTDGWNPIDNGMNHLSTGAGFLPSTVCLGDCHVRNEKPMVRLGISHAKEKALALIAARQSSACQAASVQYGQYGSGLVFWYVLMRFPHH